MIKLSTILETLILTGFWVYVVIFGSNEFSYHMMWSDILSRDPRATLGWHYVSLMGRMQAMHYSKLGSFEKDLKILTIAVFPEEEESIVPKDINEYRYRIMIEGDRVINIAWSRKVHLRSYKQTIWFDKSTGKLAYMLCTTKEPGMSLEFANKSLSAFDDSCQVRYFNKSYFYEKTE